MKTHFTFSSTILISLLEETLSITNVDSNILSEADVTITRTLQFGNLKYPNEANLQV